MDENKPQINTTKEGSNVQLPEIPQTSQPVSTPQSLAQPTPQPVQKSPSKKIVIIFIVLLVLGLLGTLGYVFLQNKTLNIKLSPTPTSTPTPTPDPTADWKTYTDPNHTYMIKYPSEATLSLITNQPFKGIDIRMIGVNQTLKTHVENDGYNFSLAIYSEGLKNDVQQQLQKYNPDDCYGQSTCTPITDHIIDGQSAKTYSIISTFQNYEHQVDNYYLNHLDQLYVISLIYADNKDSSHPNQNIAKQILSTFRTNGLGALPSFPEGKDICGVAIDYITSIKKVDGSESGDKALQEYVSYMKRNNLEDVSGATDWQFKGIQPGISYQGKIYWLVNFHYFTKIDKLKGGNAQLYISEDGKIVRLLGCI